MSGVAGTSGRLHSEFVLFLFLQDHRETDHFFETSGVQYPQVTSGHFHIRHSTFFSHLKGKTDLVLSKDTDLRITLNIDDVSIPSRSHTHPSHSQTSRLLTSSLSFNLFFLLGFHGSMEKKEKKNWKVKIKNGKLTASFQIQEFS